MRQIDGRKRIATSNVSGASVSGIVVSALVTHVEKPSGIFRRPLRCRSNVSHMLIGDNHSWFRALSNSLATRRVSREVG